MCMIIQRFMNPKLSTNSRTLQGLQFEEINEFEVPRLLILK